MGFKKFLKTKKNDDTPIGDFARDVECDKQFPVCKTKKKLLDYLYSKGACYEAIEAAEEAWEEYQETEE